MSVDIASTIKASIVDGIALTPRFRERSLAALHKALEDARAEILEAAKPAGMTDEEALFQYLLTLNAIKIFHSTVHPQTCNDIEYRIARSKDHPDQRRPHGYVYVATTDTDDVYSTVTAVAAALSAGNCVLVQRHSEQTALSALLETVLTRSLSCEVLAFVSEDPFDATFQTYHRIALHKTEAGMAELRGASVLGNTGLNVAIVDRTGDLRAAARDCVHARFAFGGRSAYAPDLVLVNDFCLKEFTAAVAEAALQYLAGHAGSGSGHASSKPRSESRESASQAAMQSLEKTGTVVASGDKGKVIVLHERDEKLLSQKVTSPVLLIHSVTSVDDAIDYLNSSSTPMLTATYIYSSPGFAKYASQFVRTSLSLVNHIPPELLVGPPAPLGLATSIHPRYTPEMFSIASPTLVERDAQLPMLNQSIWPDLSATRRRIQGSRLEGLIDTKLTPVKEPFGPAVGFFEQGFLFGASLVLSSTILCCVLSARYVYPYLMLRLR